MMKYPFITLTTLLLLVFAIGGCGPQQDDKAHQKKEKAFRNYCLMNATEAYDFTLPGAVMVQDIEGRHIRLDSLALEDKLILRISNHFGEEAVRAEIRQLDSLQERSHVAILATYENLRLLKIAINQFDIKVPVYNLTNPLAQELFGRNDSKEMPYLFVLRSNLHCESVFFPSPDFPRFSADYYKRVTAQLRSVAAEPVICQFPDVNLGKVKKGHRYEVEYVYTNTGTKPLVLNDVRSTCGCVVPKWKGEPLKSGESAVLKVYFTPKSLGYNLQSVFISHNQSGEPFRLTVTADVVSDD